MKLFLFLLTMMNFAIGADPAPKKPIDEFFRDKTKIDNPLELRDPFKAPPVKSESGNKQRGNYFISGKGQYSNISDAALETVSLQKLKVVGVLIGKERRALVQPDESSKEVIILKEGMKVGQDGAELKAILPGGVVLVEKIINVYGQEEYLETVIPISK